MTIFNSLISGCWFVFFVVWFFSSLEVKKAINENNQQVRSWIRLLVFVVIVWFFNPRALQNLGLPTHYFIPSYLFLQVVGLLICASGIAFAIWAKIYLGTNWDTPMTHKEKTELVTSGPYNVVRHPIYFGICLGMFGSALTLGLSWFIWFIFLSISFVYTATNEEKFLLSKFPKEYREYCRQTKMIFPFIF